MKKTIFKIFLIIALLFSFWIISVNAENIFTGDNKEIKITTWGATRASDWNNLWGSANWGSKIHKKNDLFMELKDTKRHFKASENTWEKAIRNMIFNIAKNIKNIFLAITWVYFLIIVLRLLFTENAEEEFEKFKKWIIWITAWIILMQVSYSFVDTIFNKEVDAKLAWSLIENIVQPMVKLLETAASFFFIAIAIFAFFRIISSNWEEEKAKKWKISVAYAIIWFLVIKVSNFLVTWIYSKTLCKHSSEIGTCNAVEIKETAWVMFDVINWTNGFVWIVVVIMIIYTWFQIIFSNWEDEKIKKSKKSLLYIVIWIIILTMNYIILTFFLKGDLTTVVT